MPGEDDGGQPGWRRTFWVLWLSQMVAMVAFAAVLPFMPLYVQALGVADPGEAAVWAGAIASAAALTQAAMAPVWGIVADRYGRKPMVTRSILSGGVVVTAMAYVADVGQLLALRSAQGVFAGTLSAARVLVASIVPPGKLGQSLGLMATGAFVGGSAGPLLGGLVADRFGFRASFLVTGALLVLSGLAVILFVRERFERPSGARAGGWRANFAVLVELPRVRAVVVSIFVVQAGQTAVSPVLPLFVKELIGGDASAASIAGAILGASAFTGAAAAAIGGRLGDRVGHGRVLAVAALASGLLYLPQAFVADPWQLLALRASAGAFFGGIMPVQMAIVALLTPPERRGWVFGLTATAMALGNAVGPIVGAGAASAFGLRASFVVTSVALTAAGVWVALAVRAPRSVDGAVTSAP